VAGIVLMLTEDCSYCFSSIFCCDFAECSKKYSAIWRLCLW